MVVFDLVVVRIIVHSLFVFESNKYSELHCKQLVHMYVRCKQCNARYEVYR